LTSTQVVKSRARQNSVKKCVEKKRGDILLQTSYLVTVFYITNVLTVHLVTPPLDLMERLCIMYTPHGDCALVAKSVTPL